jgi:hypothetical protein
LNPFADVIPNRRERRRADALARARKVSRKNGASRSQEKSRRRVERAAEANKLARMHWEREVTDIGTVWRAP